MTRGHSAVVWFLVWLLVVVGGLVGAVLTDSALWLVLVFGGWVGIALLRRGFRSVFGGLAAGSRAWRHGETFGTPELDELNEETPRR